MRDEIDRFYNTNPTPSPATVRVKAGYLGQIIVAGEIVFESTTAHESVDDARDEVVEKIKSSYKAVFSN